MIRTIFTTLLAILVLQVPVFAQDKNNLLFIEQAVKLAQKNDPWIEGNQHLQDATTSMSVAAGSLPDPQMSLSLANLPTDSFSFSQEGMAQVRLGVTQMFPQGKSLSIKRRQLELQSKAFPHQREDRNAKVGVTVSHLWLDAYKAQKSIALIEENRSLFEQLTDIATSSYSTAMGKTRQQDIIRAQLELTRLNDRVTMLGQTKDSFVEKLSEWLNTQDKISSQFEIADDLPNQTIDQPQFVNDEIIVREEELYEALGDHPMMKALEQNIDATAAGVDLAKQKLAQLEALQASKSSNNTSESHVKQVQNDNDEQH